MDSPDKWQEAYRLFVEEGLEPQQISSKLNIPRMELGGRMARERWRPAREEHLRKQGIAVNGPEDHASVADELVAIGREIARELSRTDLDPTMVRQLRGRAEAFRTTVEATDRAVRLSRDSRGLRLGQPSAPQKTESTSIEYIVDVSRSDQEKKAESA